MMIMYYYWIGTFPVMTADIINEVIYHLNNRINLNNFIINGLKPKQTKKTKLKQNYITYLVIAVCETWYVILQSYKEVCKLCKLMDDVTQKNHNKKLLKNISLLTTIPFWFFNQIIFRCSKQLGRIKWKL